jgi:hypothetical protein
MKKPGSLAGFVCRMSLKGNSMQRDPPVYLEDALKALRGNQRLLDPAKNNVAYNLSTALLYLCREVGRIEGSVDSLHNKLQPILKNIADDYEVAREITGRD